MAQIHKAVEVTIAVCYACMQFNALYEAAIDGAERAPLAARRIANITEHLTWQITCYVSRGLFERHKVTFAWMLAVSILTSAGKARALPSAYAWWQPCVRFM